MTTIWTFPADTVFEIDSAEEETNVSFDFPVESPGQTTFQLDSGELPPGLRIEKSKIVGTVGFLPGRVSKIYLFQIRATVSKPTINTDGSFAREIITSNRFFRIQINVNFWKFTDNQIYDAGSVEEGADFFFNFPVINPKNTTFFLVDGSLPPGLDIVQRSITGTAIGENVPGPEVFVFSVKGVYEQRILNDAGATVTIVTETVRTFKILLKIKIWSTPNSFNYGLYQERRYYNLDLPLNPNKDFSKITFKLISGKLPPGMRIEGTQLVGSPFEVARTTEFKFVIRAQYEGSGYDKTFDITIAGADDPRFVTPKGLLPVGNNDALYILDTSYVDFRIDAIDNDTATGQKLLYSIFDGEGELPPGLILTDDGRIVGFIQPLLAIPILIDNGNYDTSVFDKVAYDFGFRSTNGFDHWVFDLLKYDTSTPALYPKKLNRNYEFQVTVSDGDSISKRIFRIYVVGEDHFRADSEAHRVGIGTYTADVSYVKSPIWVTPPNLGIKRADNYHIFKLDTYEDEFEVGPIIYQLERTNPGIYRFRSTGEITRNGKYEISEEFPSYPSTGEPATSTSEWEVIEPETYTRLPPGMQFDAGSAEVLGLIPYMPALTKEFKFTVTAIRFSDSQETNKSSRTFTVNIVGELEKTINWISPKMLGTIQADLYSTLFVKAKSVIPNSVIIYSKTGGRLPPGLSLNLDGEIVGRVNQFNNIEIPNINGNGLTTFDGGDFTLDARSTTIDREFTFTVKSKDSLNYSELEDDFTIKVETPNDILYSNIVVKPFLRPDVRAKFRSFITDPDIFDVTRIYRLNDPNFGIQNDLKMIIYGGIESREAVEFVTVVSKNHKRKRFKLGNVKVAQAKIPGTNTVLYETVYIDVIDPLEIGKRYLPERIEHYASPTPVTIDQDNSFYGEQSSLDTLVWQPADPFLVTLDSDAVGINDAGTKFRFPSSVSLWRKRIKDLGKAYDNPADTDRHYLPLWMRTVQDGTVQELGFIKAIPLCYCKPGEGAEIVLNIKNSKFDFKQIDYVIDRYIIDRIVEDDKYVTQDRYIAFPNNRISIV
jgi:hypothetical protein